MAAIRRYPGFYTFRAWIDERGSNEDKAHERYCAYSPAHVRHCKHQHLWDLNESRHCRNILRVIRRRRPFYLHVSIGPRYWSIARIGRNHT